MLMKVVKLLCINEKKKPGKFVFMKGNKKTKVSNVDKMLEAMKEQTLSFMKMQRETENNFYQNFLAMTIITMSMKNFC